MKGEARHLFLFDWCLATTHCRFLISIDIGAGVAYTLQCFLFEIPALLSCGIVCIPPLRLPLSVNTRNGNGSKSIAVLYDKFSMIPCFQSSRSKISRKMKGGTAASTSGHSSHTKFLLGQVVDISMPHVCMMPMSARPIRTPSLSPNRTIFITDSSSGLLKGLLVQYSSFFPA